MSPFIVFSLPNTHFNFYFSRSCWLSSSPNSKFTSLTKKKQNLPRKKIYPEEIFPLLNSSNHRINTTIMLVTYCRSRRENIEKSNFIQYWRSIESCLVVHLLFSLPYNYNIFWLNIAVFGYILKKKVGPPKKLSHTPFFLWCCFKKITSWLLTKRTTSKIKTTTKRKYKAVCNCEQPKKY